MKRIILFTASYPYGKKEVYLEPEIKYLSDNFEKIIIYPFYYNNKDIKSRSVPNNVIVNKPLIPLLRIHQIKLFIVNFFFIFYLFNWIIDFFLKRVILNKKKFNIWIVSLFHTLIAINSNKVKSLNEIEDAIFYFYWGTGWAHVLPFIKKNKSNLYITRFHGGDIILAETHPYLPIRRKVINSSDILMPISNLAKSYIIDNFSVDQNKIMLSRLGTNYYGKNYPLSDSIIRVISVANCEIEKRIDLIIDALALIDNKRVEWIHIGSGSLINQLLNYANVKIKSPMVTFKFLGQLNNINIMNLYKDNHIDAFINTSMYEGVPFSIIEAISFGIPCIATNVGATSEVVNCENGYLLDYNFSSEILKKLIVNLKSEYWKSKRVRSFNYWDNNFNSEVTFPILLNIMRKR